MNNKAKIIEQLRLKNFNLNALEDFVPGVSTFGFVATPTNNIQGAHFRRMDNHQIMTLQPGKTYILYQDTNLPDKGFFVINY